MEGLAKKIHLGKEMMLVIKAFMIGYLVIMANPKNALNVELFQLKNMNGQIFLENIIEILKILKDCAVDVIVFLIQIQGQMGKIMEWQNLPIKML